MKNTSSILALNTANMPEVKANTASKAKSASNQGEKFSKTLDKAYQEEAEVSSEVIPKAELNNEVVTKQEMAKEEDGNIPEESLDNSLVVMQFMPESFQALGEEIAVQANAEGISISPVEGDGALFLEAMGQSQQEITAENNGSMAGGLLQDLAGKEVIATEGMAKATTSMARVAVNAPEALLPTLPDMEATQLAKNASKAVKNEAGILTNPLVNTTEEAQGAMIADKGHHLLAALSSNGGLSTLTTGSRMTIGAREENLPQGVDESTIKELLGEFDTVTIAKGSLNKEGSSKNTFSSFKGEGLEQDLSSVKATITDTIGKAFTLNAEEPTSRIMENTGGQVISSGTVDTMNQEVARPDGNVVPRDDFQVVRQIVEQARLIRNNAGNREMVIKLNPEHLGELTLKVSVAGNGGVTATFHSDNAQVRAILEASIVQLKQNLDEQGLKVDSVEVHTGLGDGQLPDSQQGGAYQQENFHSARADREAFEETSEAMMPLAEEQYEDSLKDGIDYAV